MSKEKGVWGALPFGGWGWKDGIPNGRIFKSDWFDLRKKVWYSRDRRTGGAKVNREES